MTEKAYTFKLDKYVWDIISISFILFIVSLFILNFSGSEGIKIQGIADIVISTIFTLALHESLHAITAILFGYKTRIGYGKISFMPVFYTTVSGKVKPRKWMIICLTPLAFSPIILVLAFYLSGFLKNIMAIVFTFNLLGSSGDLILALSVVKMDKNTILEDKGPYITANKPFPKPFGKCFSIFLKIIVIIIIAWLFVINAQIS